MWALTDIVHIRDAYHMDAIVAFLIANHYIEIWSWGNDRAPRELRTEYSDGIFYIIKEFSIKNESINENKSYPLHGFITIEHLNAMIYFVEVSNA